MTRASPFKHWSITHHLLFLLMIASAAYGCWLKLDQGAQAQAAPIKWHDALKQSREWYGSAEAARIADNLIAYQRESGGWPKNIDMAVLLSQSQRADIAKEKGSATDLSGARLHAAAVAGLSRVVSQRVRLLAESAIRQWWLAPVLPDQERLLSAHHLQ